MTSRAGSAAEAGRFRIGDIEVNRLGFGAMRITGEGVWGPPEDRDESIRVLRRAVELGVDLIDTADAYGPNVSEELIAEALHPYPEGLTIATKAGLERSGPGQWHANGRPEHIKDACEGSLQRLRVERIDLYQFHRPDPDVPIEESLGAFKELQDAGKVRHIGVSNFDVAQLEKAREAAEIVTVQNRYNLTDRASEEVVEACAKEGIGFIPWFPLATGDLAGKGSKVKEVAERLDATPSQVALAWLLDRSEVILPIPGTSSVEHLEENVGAASVKLDDEALEALASL